MKIIKLIKDVFNKTHISKLSNDEIENLIERTNIESMFDITSSKNLLRLRYMQGEKFLGLMQTLVDNQTFTYSDVNQFIKIYNKLTDEQKDLLNVVGLATNIVLDVPSFKENYPEFLN